MAVIENGAHEQKSQKKKKSESAEDKRKQKIVPGSLMKALIRPGSGDATPTDGDQVMYHCTIRTLDGVIVESTRAEFGGKGIPTRHVLGKSKMILGLLEGITTMKKGEVAMFKMKPELHYGEDDCPVSVSDSFPKEAELHFDNESQNMIVYIHIMPPDRSTLVLKSLSLSHSTTCTHVGLMDDIRGMNVIPQELIEGIVSHTSLLDACEKVSIVSRDFCSAAKFNNIWERFLPAELISHQAVSDQWMFYDSCKRINLDTLQAFPTKKIINDGSMYFWLDKLTWNKCFGILFPLSTMVLKSLSPRWLLPVNTVHTPVDLMGDVSEMNVLPQELIEEIVSHTSPVDVCGSLSIVSRKFRSAAKSDHVWERFLPADLISRRAKPSESHFKIYVEDPWKKIDSDTLQAFPTKKDLYLFLSDNPVIIDDGDMYFWLDRLSGGKCFLLVPEKLSIPEPDGWYGSYSYYELTLPFRIEGKISTSLLSPNTLYTAYLSFDFTCLDYFTGFGEEEPLQTCVGIDGGCESESRIVYIPFMPCEYERHTNILKCRPPNMPVLSGPQYPRKRYGCYELELGDYFNKDGGGDNRELKMCLSEIKTGEAKGGIHLHGIEIRPKQL